MGLQSQKGHR